MEPPKWSFEKVGQVMLIQSIDSSKKQNLKIIPLCNEIKKQTDISNNSDSNNSFFQFYDFQFEIPQIFFDIHNIFS